MKITKILAGAVLAASLATTASAQVATSFDNLVDEVLGTVNEVNTNAAFFSGAVNTADIDGSVNISAGSLLPAGTLDIAASTTTAASSSDGQLGSAANNATSAIEAGLTVNTITQEFGDVSSVAAGAISDSTMVLNETGSLASSAVDTSGSLTNFVGSSSNTAGSTVGVVQGALNTGGINGSITLAMQNAAGGATSVGSVAAGAINTGDITATFVGGSEAATNVTTP